MNENGFCPCGNFGVLDEDCHLCGKPFSSDVHTIAPGSAERSAVDSVGRKDAALEEFVARYNPRLRLAEALESTGFYGFSKNGLSELSLPEVAELLSLFSEEQLELLTVCEPGELAELLAEGPEYPSWNDYAIFHARENGYEDRADIVELVGTEYRADEDTGEGSIAIAFGQLVSLISLVILSLLVQFNGENCFESLTIVVWMWPLLFFVVSTIAAFSILTGTNGFARPLGRLIIGRRKRILLPLLLCHMGWATFIYAFFVATICL